MTTSNKNPGNFANDREKASEAGKKGGPRKSIRSGPQGRTAQPWRRP
jgi:general stress protein YciG